MNRSSKIALALGFVFPFGVIAYGSTAEAHAEPYGGCDEAWQAPHSPGADDCRAHGWTIRPRLVVNPRHVVMMSALPPCRNEDGSGQRSACSWNFGLLGDGTGPITGHIFWNDQHDRSHYVR